MTEQTNNRIKLNDSIKDIILKMSDGVPGAIEVLVRLWKYGSAHDPENMLKGLAPILALDTLGLYGSSIWLLYKDNCRQDLGKMIAVLRGWQLGFVSSAKIRNACADDAHNPQAFSNVFTEEQIEEIVNKVCNKLPQFKVALE